MAMRPAQFEETFYSRAKYVRLQIAHDAPKVPTAAELSAKVTVPPLPEVSPSLVRDLNMLGNDFSFEANLITQLEAYQKQQEEFTRSVQENEKITNDAMVKKRSRQHSPEANNNNNNPSSSTSSRTSNTVTDDSSPWGSSLLDTSTSATNTPGNLPSITTVDPSVNLLSSFHHTRTRTTEPTVPSITTNTINTPLSSSSSRPSSAQSKPSSSSSSSTANNTKYPTNSTLNASQTLTTPSTPTANETWECSGCTFINSSALNQCEMCGTNKGFSSPPPPSSATASRTTNTRTSQPTTSSTVPSSLNYPSINNNNSNGRNNSNSYTTTANTNRWTCRMCTNVNSPNSTICEICASSRDTARTRTDV